VRALFGGGLLVGGCVSGGVSWGGRSVGFWCVGSSSGVEVVVGVRVLGGELLGRDGGWGRFEKVSGGVWKKAVVLWCREGFGGVGWLGVLFLGWFGGVVGCGWGGWVGVGWWRVRRVLWLGGGMGGGVGEGDCGRIALVSEARVGWGDLGLVWVVGGGSVVVVGGWGWGGVWGWWCDAGGRVGGGRAMGVVGGEGRWVRFVCWVLGGGRGGGCVVGCGFRWGLFSAFGFCVVLDLGGGLFLLGVEVVGGVLGLLCGVGVWGRESCFVGEGGWGGGWEGTFLDFVWFGELWGWGGLRSGVVGGWRGGVWGGSGARVWFCSLGVVVCCFVGVCGWFVRVRLFGGCLGGLCWGGGGGWGVLACGGWRFEGWGACGGGSFMRVGEGGGSGGVLVVWMMWGGCVVVFGCAGRWGGGGFALGGGWCCLLRGLRFVCLGGVGEGC